MGQHLAKREQHADAKTSTQAEATPNTEETESQDEVFGLTEADVNQNNGCPSKRTAVTDSTGAAGPQEPWSVASTADPNDAGPRPHLVRLFSRDAPGREDNTFKDRPSESDELQTIQEHGGVGSECGSEQDED
ncbi:myelin basic protein-like [Denticeps clupeoides]|uniref:Myelin basic protein n=1 Tax=Denticeps clupeoides TaxID=299321 RepID=A0AAY4EGR9_9TELE|nr:myelin basic protein [Denticeps clupeoides]